MSIYYFPKVDAIQQLYLDKNQVIEASAGTGKTYTIEQIIVELILEKQICLDNILLVTYTEAAAIELKNRVRQKLEQMLLGKGSDIIDTDLVSDKYWAINQEKKCLLMNAINYFDIAFIGTIHSFCAKITKEFPFICNLILHPQQSDIGFQKFFFAMVRRKSKSHFSKF